MSKRAVNGRHVVPDGRHVVPVIAALCCRAGCRPPAVCCPLLVARRWSSKSRHGVIERNHVDTEVARVHPPGGARIHDLLWHLAGGAASVVCCRAGCRPPAGRAQLLAARRRSRSRHGVMLGALALVIARPPLGRQVCLQDLTPGLEANHAGSAPPVQVTSGSGWPVAAITRGPARHPGRGRLNSPHHPGLESLPGHLSEGPRVTQGEADWESTSPGARMSVRPPRGAGSRLRAPITQGPGITPGSGVRVGSHHPGVLDPIACRSHPTHNQATQGRGPPRTESSPRGLQDTRGEDDRVGRHTPRAWWEGWP